MSYQQLSIRSKMLGIGVTLSCTDPAVLEWIFPELKTIMPSASILRYTVVEDIATGEPCQIELHKLKGKDTAVIWWIIQLLCKNDWEPFAVNSIIQGWYYTPRNVYHYRKKEER